MTTEDDSALWTVECPTCRNTYDVRQPQKVRYLCHRAGNQIVPVLVCSKCNADIMSTRQKMMLSDGELLDPASIVGLDPLGFLR